MRGFLWNSVKKADEGSPMRKLGLGASIGDNGTSKADRKTRFVGMVKGLAGSPTFQFPVLDSVTVHYDGPITLDQAKGSFGTKINPLGVNADSPPAGASQVDTTFAEPGKFQTYVLICAIQFRIDIEPLFFTAKGNAWTTPTTGSAKPVSPDMFNVPDLSTANGTLGLTTGQTMVPADLQWGWWQDLMAFHMFRGFNLFWQYGNRFSILNDNLRYTAFIPGSAQDGSSSNSEVDVNYFARQTNDYYRQQFNSPQIFTTIDRTRLGNMTLSEQAGLSVYRPARAYETTGVTYGGGGSRNMIRGNSEWRRLAAPFIAVPGMPLGLYAQESSNDDADLMRNYMSASYQYNTIPATFTEDQNINVGPGVAAAGNIGQEPSLDSPSVPQGQQLLAQRTIFKGGGFKVSIGFKGFELTPDQADLLKDVSVLQSIQSDCGCGISFQ
jgi:hypothetical protein